MTHIANQRIKKDGKFYAPGEPITLTGADLKGLPVGAVRAADPEADDAPTDLTAEQAAALKAALSSLKAGDFKQDGEIRAGALRELCESLGFAVSVADIAAARASED